MRWRVKNILGKRLSINEVKFTDMKTHLIRQEYKTGKRVAHFKTVCGKIRHVITDLPNTKDKSKVTCKICLTKK